MGVESSNLFFSTIFRRGIFRGGGLRDSEECSIMRSTMRHEVVVLLALSGLLAARSPAQEPGGAPAEAPKENPELEAEMNYVEALVNYGYPDLAGPVMEATKKK